MTTNTPQPGDATVEIPTAQQALEMDRNSKELARQAQRSEEAVSYFCRKHGAVHRIPTPRAVAVGLGYANCDCPQIAKAMQHPEYPWLQPNENDQYPGEICCLRAAGPYCYEHDKFNFPKAMDKAMADLCAEFLELKQPLFNNPAEAFNSLCPVPRAIILPDGRVLKVTEWRPVGKLETHHIEIALRGYISWPQDMEYRDGESQENTA